MEERWQSGPRRDRAAGVVSHRARNAIADGTRFSRTFSTKLAAESWLSAERALLHTDQWSPPAVRKLAEQQQAKAAAENSLAAYAERSLSERPLRPKTLAEYQAHLKSRILPSLGELTLAAISVSEIKAWRSSLDASTPAPNAAAYRLLGP